MKASLLLATLSLSLAAAVSAQAQTADPAAPAPDFTTQKANLMARIDQRVAAMTAMRDCVNAAASPTDLKTCRKQARGTWHKQHAPA